MPLSAAVAGTLNFLSSGALVGGHSLDGAMKTAPVFLAVGAVIGAIVGCPLVCLLEDLLWRIRGKHVAAGAVGAVLGWLLLEGAFAGATDVLSGSLYTLLVILIGRVIPRKVHGRRST